MLLIDCGAASAHTSGRSCCFAGSGCVRRVSRLHNYYQLLQTQLPLSHDDSPVGPGRLVWDTLSTLYGPLDLGNLWLSNCGEPPRVCYNVYLSLYPPLIQYTCVPLYIFVLLWFILSSWYYLSLFWVYLFAWFWVHLFDLLLFCFVSAVIWRGVNQLFIALTTSSLWANLLHRLSFNKLRCSDIVLLTDPFIDDDVLPSYELIK